MNRYYSTFITGFEDVIKAALERSLRDVEVDLLLDGLVVFRTAASPSTVVKLRFFNNSFLLFFLLEERSDNPIGDLMSLVVRNRSLDEPLCAYVPQQTSSFRIIASRENQLVAMPPDLLAKMEQRLVHLTRLRVNRSKPDVEYWFLYRREGYGFFGVRLTRHRDYAKVLDKGELRPELAHILCLLSDPHGSDRFLDPFAGSGAIPRERAASFPFRQIIVGDTDSMNVKRLAVRLRDAKGRIKVRLMDARDLRDIADSSIDKIVTDPPWGLYKSSELDIPTLYRGMLREFARILRSSGLVVVMVADKALLEDIIKDFEGDFESISLHHTLVSGKKAGVYKLSRTPKIEQVK